MTYLSNKLKGPSRAALLVLPLLLTSSTALAFTSLARWLGADLGYLAGFAFYWLWCVGVPLVLFGKDGFWRGTYVKAFGHNALLACVYPALGFAISHISPGLVFPAKGGVWPFVLSTFFLGLAYGWVAYKTGSARWTAITHSLIGLLAFGQPLSASIVRLLFP